ncbi:MAG: hypothetical protein WC058_15560, partial [Phycisphaeraceae bacterium]
MLAFFVVGASWAVENVAHLDPLQPEADRRFQELDNLFRDCEANGLSYKVSVEEKVIGQGHIWGGGVVTHYHFGLPSNITAIFNKGGPGKQRLLEAELYYRLRDPKYSYYAGVLTMAHEKCGPPKKNVQPIADKDKAAWDREYEKYAKYLINLLQITPYPHQKQVFLDGMPQVYKKRLSQNKHEWGAVVDPPFTIEITKQGGYFPTTMPEFKKIEEALASYQSDGRTDALQQLGEDSDTLRNWTMFLFNVDDETRMKNLKAFDIYARQHNQSKGFFSAWMMNMLVAIGYQYDRDADQCVLNPAGKIMLEYAIEHPIPENMDTLRILREHGNADEIDSLIKKHHASEWAAFEKQYRREPANKRG